ncbi:MAG TPA: hypothetical protein VLJ86_09925 [Ramlibacter sp.]|nr:hypothetical protein [Ramlibacter sp.]
MSYITTFYCHAQAVQDAASPLGIEATVQLSDFALCLKDEQRTQLWRPRFLANVNGRLVYASHFGRQTAGFAGWMPYATRQWPIAIDKSAFKRQARADNVPTPMACLDPALIGGPFIVKKSASSFGEGIRGPYTTYDATHPAHQLATGEYYENFIVGHIAKAWCWGSKCVALHLHAPTTVVGDGQRTLRELVRALPNNRGGDNDWALVGRLAAYCGAGGLDEVLGAGKETLVEFRYGSRYDKPLAGNPNLLWQLGLGTVTTQFHDAARIFSQAISRTPARRNACFTLDAMVDAAGKAWFLEMNCNPLVHPDLYGAMIAAMRNARPPPAKA